MLNAESNEVEQAMIIKDKENYEDELDSMYSISDD